MRRLSVSSRLGAASVVAGAWLLMTLVGSGCKPSEPSVPSAATRGQSPIALRDVAATVGVDFRLGHPGREALTILETIGHGCAFLDYDRDGKLDLVLLGPDKVKLYRGDGARFQESTTALPQPLRGYWVGAAVGDYDNDGYPDLFLNGHRCRVLLRNQAGKRFVDVTAQAGLKREGPEWGTSAGFVDLDQDGRLDLFLCRYVRFDAQSRQYCSEAGREMTCAPRMYPPELPAFYRNEGNGRFADRTERFGFHQTAGRSLGLVPLDYDDDGWTDLYVANDTEPAALFHSRRGQRFEEVAAMTGTAVAEDGRALGGMGLDAQDFDRDGRVDLSVTTFEAEPKCLWRNIEGIRFEDRSGPAGLDPLRSLVSWGTGLVDLDNDGWLDWIATSGHVLFKRIDPNYAYAQPLRLYRGEGGEFRDAEPALDEALRKPLVGRGIAFGDYDNDGKVDAVVSNLDGAALLIHNESPGTGHWIGLELEGTRSNRMGLGARVTVEGGREKWVAEAKTARSIYSASDARVHFGLGAVDRIDRISVRWPSGCVSKLQTPDLDRYHRIVEPRGSARKAGG